MFDKATTPHVLFADMVIAIDPGITTGVAVLDDDGDVSYTYTLRGSAEDVVSNLLVEASTIFDAPVTGEDIVIEQGPSVRQIPYLDDLDARLRIAFPCATWMRPTEWKDYPGAKDPLGSYVAVSQHARDAARMGRVYLRKDGRASNAPHSDTA